LENIINVLELIIFLIVQVCGVVFEITYYLKLMVKTQLKNINILNTQENEVFFF